MQGGDMNTMKKCSTCGTLYSNDLCPKCMAGFAQKSTDPTAPPEELPLRPGQIFHGLEILELLGKGGMGVVYKARQPALDRLVALKILPPEDGAATPTSPSRFIREAKALGSLSHPQHRRRLRLRRAERALLLRRWSSSTASTCARSSATGKLTPEQALKIVPQLCEALDTPTSEGVVHRDIKPENILLDKKGRVKIADFGLAKLHRRRRRPGRHRSPCTSMVMGTPHYMAPEQIEQPQGVDHRADIYSLGVVFYEMLTGELPIGRFESASKKVQSTCASTRSCSRRSRNRPIAATSRRATSRTPSPARRASTSPESYSPTLITPRPAKKSRTRPWWPWPE